MILCCWRDGRLGIVRRLPAGAMEVARGGSAAMQGLLSEIVACDGLRGEPCMAELAGEPDDARARDMLRADMRRWATGAQGARVRFNHALDTRFAGDE